MKMILLGPPGAGKGTQAQFLSERFNVTTISTGAMIRGEIDAKTALGIAAKQYIEEGLLVPDEVVIGMLRDRVEQEDCKNGFILDGVPRTIAQAEDIAKFTQIDAVVSISLSDDVVVERLSGRRECSKCRATYHIKYNPPDNGEICGKCGAFITIRPDDMPETIRKRLTVYHAQTEPLKAFYKKGGILTEVDGTQEIEEVTGSILNAVEVAL